LRVVLASGYTDDEKLLKQIPEGSVTFVAKPVKPSQLLEVLRRVMDGRSDSSR
jgi:FixJ family two-component response regulator